MNALSHALANAFIASTWQAALLAVALGLALRMTPRTTAATRYAIWTAALAIFAVLPFLPTTSHAAASKHAAALHLAPWWSTAIAAVWIALSAVRLVQLVLSAASLHSIARQATPVADWQACTVPGTTRTAVLCTSDDVVRPSVLGFTAPRILIPASLYARLTRAELEQIVLHEMQHLRRRDDWANLLQKVGLVLFPLNPALLWVERRLCLERELACDDGVLRITNAPRAYASTLVNLAEQSLVRSRLSLALGAWERRSELATRVHAILRATGGNRRPATALAAGMIAALLGGAATLSRAPQLVSFAAPSALAAALVEQPAPTAYQPVRFDPAQTPHATLLKAVMPQASEASRSIEAVHGAEAPCFHRKAFSPASESLSTAPSGFSRSAKSTRSHAARRRVVSAGPAQAPRLTLTTFDATQPDAPEAAPAPRVVFTVIHTTSFRSYAAVPMPDGWLIIQL